MKWRLGICDDEIKYHKEIETLCKSYVSKNKIHTEFCFFNNADDLLDCTDNIDVLFLDIEMGKLSGIDILPNLGKRHNISHIIFITSHTESILDTFSVKTVGFISKPIDSHRLYSFLDMIKEDYQSNSIIEFFVGFEKKNVYVSTQDILYLEGKENYTRVYTTDNSDGFLTYGSISYWEKNLKEYSFLRIQKSYLVNLAYVEPIMSNSHLTLTTGTSLTIGRKYAPLVRQAHTEYSLAERRRIHNAYK